MKKYTTAERLRQIMSERGLRQVDILNACRPYCEEYGVKLGKNDLSQYISGKVQPGQDKLTVLGAALNVDEVWLLGYDSQSSAELPQNSPSKRVMIPVLGTVVAGVPIEAVEEILDWEEISEDMALQGDFFGLQIKGNSMTPRLLEGDVVIVRQQPDAETGSVVIAKINGDEACCKKLIKYEDGISLVSYNPDYPPMYFSNREILSRPVSIIGKVIELRGKL